MLKHNSKEISWTSSLITVQDNTMLKPWLIGKPIEFCLITVQDNTMLKPINWIDTILNGLITVQDNTMLKQV